MDPWGTHFPILAACVARTKGPVLELGCGWYSTFMLHLLCSPGKRRLVSLEARREWLEKFKDLRTDSHELHRVEDMDRFTLIDEVDWDVALVDHSPGTRRVREIERLKKRARHIVVHDTEDPSYGYEKILPRFKYRYDYKRLTPWTSVVSDFEPFVP